MRHFVAVAVLLVMAACAPSPSSVPLAAGEIALPTEPPVSLPPGAVEACAGVAIGAVLHGATADPRAAWLIDDFSGTRIDVEWPPGYRARFTPNLEVLDGSEVVVLKAGDPVTGGCVVNAAPATLLLEPPFQ